MIPAMNAPLSPGTSPSTTARPTKARPEDLMGEFTGLRLVITEAPGIQPLPFAGTVLDETLNLFYVRPDGATRARAIPKAGLVGALSTGGREIPLRGDDLRVRPEDRIKRLAPRGRRARR